jgi:OsmC-like protein
MTTTEMAAAQASEPTRNGVDTATLFTTLDAVKGDPEIAKFRFRATNTWVSGTHNRSTIHGFHGAKQEITHRQPFTFTADHPPVLVGEDHGPTPAEYLLHALAACLTAGIATIAAARGVSLTEVSSTVEGDIDLLGILGLSDQVRNGYQQIRGASDCAATNPRSCARWSNSPADGLPCSTSSRTVPVSIDVDAG